MGLFWAGKCKDSKLSLELIGCHPWFITSMIIPLIPYLLHPSSSHNPEIDQVFNHCCSEEQGETSWRKPRRGATQAPIHLNPLCIMSYIDSTSVSFFFCQNTAGNRQITASVGRNPNKERGGGYITSCLFRFDKSSFVSCWVNYRQLVMNL